MPKILMREHHQFILYYDEKNIAFFAAIIVTRAYAQVPATGAGLGPVPIDFGTIDFSNSYRVNRSGYVQLIMSRAGVCCLLFLHFSLIEVSGRLTN